MPLSMNEYEALPGGEELVASIRHEMEDEYLRAVGDDDYLGVQCYTKIVIGPDGAVANPEGELTEMGYLFWPQSVEYTIRRAASIVDIPIIMTENGIGTDDDEQRIRYLTGALGGTGERARRRHRRARLFPVVTARQLRVDLRLSSEVRHRRRRPHDVREDAQAVGRSGTPTRRESSPRSQLDPVTTSTPSRYTPLGRVTSQRRLNEKKDTR